MAEDETISAYKEQLANNEFTHEFQQGTVRHKTMTPTEMLALQELENKDRARENRKKRGGIKRIGFTRDC